MTAFFVTSAPVPAVVGMATNGSGLDSNRRPVPNHFQILDRGSLRGNQRRAIALPASITAPPPRLTTAPTPFFPRQTNAPFNILQVGFMAIDSVGDVQLVSVEFA